MTSRPKFGTRLCCQLRELPGLPHPAPSPLGVSHTLRGLLLRALSQLCFTLQPHIGFPALIRKDCRTSPALHDSGRLLLSTRRHVGDRSSCEGRPSCLDRPRRTVDSVDSSKERKKETITEEVRRIRESPASEDTRSPSLQQFASSQPRIHVPTREGSPFRPKPIRERTHIRAASAP